MRFHVPDSSDHKRVVAFGAEIERAVSFLEFEFDFGNVGFVTPAWLVLIGNALRQFRSAHPAAKCKATNYKHLGYAAHVGFFQYFGLNFGLDPAEAPGSATYVPITEVRVADVRTQATRDCVHPGEIVEEDARRLAATLTQQDKGDVVDTLTYSIREIVRNTIEHSSAESYTVAAQFWPARHLAELAVSDNGCGILSSLRENPKLALDNDLDALKLSVLPGVSSKAWRRSRRDDAWANSGYGLFMTQRLCSIGGEFVLLSGSHGIKVCGRNVEELTFGAPGTTVILRFDTSAVGDLGKRLADFREEGRALAKQVAGSNRLGPSLASRILLTSERPR